MDPMKCVMMVKAEESKYAGDNLVAMSEKQEANLDRQKELRNVQEAFDKYSQDGVITKDEHDQMQGLVSGAGLQWTGLFINGGTDNNTNGFEVGETSELEANADGSVTETEAADAQEYYDAQVNVVKDALEGSEDEQSKIGIDMQLEVQNYTDAAGEESSLSKQLSDLRNKISAKLDG